MKTYTARYNFRLDPNEAQEQYLAQTFGCVRLVFNTALQETFDVLQERKLQVEQGVPKEDLVFFNRSTLSKSLTAWKKDKTFLNEVSSVVLQHSLGQVLTAWTHCKEGRANAPNFKAKHRSTPSASYMRNAFRLEHGALLLAKCKEPFEVRWSRSLPSAPSSCTVMQDQAGRYFVSFVVEVQPLAPLCPDVEKTVGIDLGLTHFAVLSDGDKIEAPKPLQKAQKKLTKLQRALARTQKGSKNRAKARRKLATHHATIRDIRHDFLHKLSTRLVHDNQGIGMESLAVKEMMKDSHLARSMGDASWGRFTAMVKYKCEWYGKSFTQVRRWFPSTKRCSACHHVVGKLALSQRRWRCPGCGVEHDRDHNAANNIHHAAGLAEWKNACGAETSACSSLSGRDHASLCAQAGSFLW